MAGRSWAASAGLLLVTIAGGLLSRQYPAWQPAFLARYAGDTLWAAMVFWVLALLAPRRPTRHLAAAAVAIAGVVEVSQLFSTSWLDALRATRVGALVLGQGFVWSDLACYAVGVGLAAAVDAGIRARAGG